MTRSLTQHRAFVDHEESATFSVADVRDGAVVAAYDGDEGTDPYQTTIGLETFAARLLDGSIEPKEDVPGTADGQVAVHVPLVREAADLLAVTMAGDDPTTTSRKAAIARELAALVDDDPDVLGADRLADRDAPLDAVARVEWDGVGDTDVEHLAPGETVDRVTDGPAAVRVVGLLADDGATPALPDVANVEGSEVGATQVFFDDEVTWLRFYREGTGCYVTVERDVPGPAGVVRWSWRRGDDADPEDEAGTFVERWREFDDAQRWEAYPLVTAAVAGREDLLEARADED